MKQSLNIAENYVPNWSTWEVAREIICNAIDADENFTIETPSLDKLVVTTSTAPSFSQLMVIGASTKRDDDESIGQFGEGFKLAALVATRMGGSLDVRTPQGRLSFSLDSIEDLDDRVLHVNSTVKGAVAEGCRVSVFLPGIADVIGGKFTKETKITKPYGDCKIFVKGVYIGTLGQDSVFDWNLPIAVNRDRAMVDSWDAKHAIGNIFADSDFITVEDFEKIFSRGDSIEIDSCYHVSSWTTPKNSQKALTAWINVFGEKAVLASSESIVNQVAYAKGYDVVSLPQYLKNLHIPSAKDVIKREETFEEVIVEDRFYRLADKILATLEVDALVAFFKPYEKAPLGEALFDEQTIWLNREITERSVRMFITVVAHEACHIKSGYSDGTINFEKALSAIIGELLETLLEGK